ncbi:MAG: hypothetical protein QOH09_2552, partial [Pseudonocardiales bacterium]|nr:hypothetical protein [Pseudonocardiales bacterium]
RRSCVVVRPRMSVPSTKVTPRSARTRARTRPSRNGRLTNSPNSRCSRPWRRPSTFWVRPMRAKSSSSVPTTCRTRRRHERRRAGTPTAPYLLGSSKTHGRLRCPLPRPPFRQQVAGAVDRRLTVLATHHWIPSQRRRLAAQTFRVEQEHRTAARCSVLDYVELRARRDHRVGEVLDHSLRRIVFYLHPGGPKTIWSSCSFAMILGCGRGPSAW